MILRRYQDRRHTIARDNDHRHIKLLLVVALIMLSLTTNISQQSLVDAFTVTSHNLSILQKPMLHSSCCNVPTRMTMMHRMSNMDDTTGTTSATNTPTTIRPETNFGSVNVPEAQRPINEYLDVTNQPFFTWARDSTTNLELFLRFGFVYMIFFVTICYPISGATFTQEGYLLHQLLSSNVGAMGVTMLLLLRVYTGYDYIGQRLQSKYIEYEETGWYDGDVETKTKTELLRDRMLYTSQVQPIVERLRLFVTVGTTYFIGSIILLNVVLTKYPVFDQYDPDVLNRLSYDDRLADSAAINTNGKPAYCDSRYYRAIANGGLGCN